MIRILTMAMAVCAVLGALDRIAGGRFGLAKPFEEGFQMLGPVALSMAGILCLAPLLASGASHLAPFLRHAGLEPALLSSVLAIDMGGYQMAEALASGEDAGLFYGIMVCATLGCTISFTIPTGMGLYGKEDQERFAQGLLYGLVTLPLGLMAAALLMGLRPVQALKLCLPMLLAALLLAALLRWRPRGTVRALQGFAGLLRALTTAGLGLGAFQQISGVVLLPGLMPLEESMGVVSAICVTLLGSLPAAALLMRALERPLEKLGSRLGIGREAVLGLLLLYVNATPGLTAMPGMSERGKVVSSAFAVSAASALTAHVAFAMRFAPETAGPLLAGKLVGALAAAALALAATMPAKRPRG